MLTFVGLYIKKPSIDLKTIRGVGTDTAGFVGTAERRKARGFDNSTFLNTPVCITGWNDFVEKFGRYSRSRASYLPFAVKGFFDNGGSRCWIVLVKEGAGDKEYIGTDKGIGKRTGLQALKDIDEINIVCIPGVTSPVVQQAMVAHCEMTGDRVCILDSHKGADLNEVSGQRDRVASEEGYGALYYPWIRVPVDTEKNSRARRIYRFVPPSGHIAGIYARSDRIRGVHKAPANLVVKGALELETLITQTGQGVLNPKGINCIRFFTGRGIVVWGGEDSCFL